MFLAISPDPLAASVTDRAVWLVVAVCSSTAPAESFWIASTRRAIFSGPFAVCCQVPHGPVAEPPRARDGARRGVRMEWSPGGSVTGRPGGLPVRQSSGSSADSERG
jgi:hypothetical protein